MVISRVIIRVTPSPFRALITLNITYLLGPLPLQVNPKGRTSESPKTAQATATFTSGVCADLPALPVVSKRALGVAYGKGPKDSIIRYLGLGLG